MGEERGVFNMSSQPIAHLKGTQTDSERGGVLVDLAFIDSPFMSSMHIDMLSGMHDCAGRAYTSKGQDACQSIQEKTQRRKDP